MHLTSPDRRDHAVGWESWNSRRRFGSIAGASNFLLIRPWLFGLARHDPNPPKMGTLVGLPPASPRSTHTRTRTSPAYRLRREAAGAGTRGSRWAQPGVAEDGANSSKCHRLLAPPRFQVLEGKKIGKEARDAKVSGHAREHTARGTTEHGSVRGGSIQGTKCGGFW